MTTRRILAGAMLSAGLARPALAQSAWPAGRPIEVIVPYPPSGGIDLIARLLTRHLPGVLPGASPSPAATGLAANNPSAPPPAAPAPAPLPMVTVAAQPEAETAAALSPGPHVFGAVTGPSRITLRAVQDCWILVRDSDAAYEVAETHAS